MVHIPKSLAIAAMILAPVLAAPVFQTEEIESFERGFDDSDLLEARQAAAKGRGRGLAAALAAFSALSAGVSLASGLSGFGAREFEDDLLLVRDVLDHGDLESRASLTTLLNGLKGLRGNIAEAAAGLTGVGLGVGAVFQGRKDARNFFDDYAEYDARDYQGYSDVFERDYYEDAMFEREFFDKLD